MIRDTKIQRLRKIKNTLAERYDIHKNVLTQTGANFLNPITEFKSVQDVFK